MLLLLNLTLLSEWAASADRGGSHAKGSAEYCQRLLQDLRTKPKEMSKNEKRVKLKCCPISLISSHLMKI